MGNGHECSLLTINALACWYARSLLHINQSSTLPDTITLSKCFLTELGSENKHLLYFVMLNLDADRIG